MADVDGPRSPGRTGGGNGNGPHEATRRMMARASRRLSILEYVFLLAAVVMALLGGALAAYGLQALGGLPFRPTWAVVSLLLFVVPAVVVWRRERRFERERREARSRGPEDAGGPGGTDAAEPGARHEGSSDETDEGR